MERLRQQIAFIMEADRLKHIVRRNHLADGSRRENDAEHSWHLALMAVLLAEHAAEPVDAMRVLQMVLIHDIVEIDAGDAFIYSTAARQEAETKEREAAERLFGLLPGDQARQFRALWEEFEECATAEARFARALDRLQPMLLNCASKGLTWREHGITARQVAEMNFPFLERGAPALRALAEQALDEAREQGYLDAE